MLKKTKPVGIAQVALTLLLLWGVLTTNVLAQFSRPSQVVRPDRWRILYDFGIVPSFFDPYNQNPIKGDFPVFGNNTFMVLTGLYVPKAVFNSQDNIDTQFNNDVLTSIELFQGTTVFEPKRWSLKASGKGIFNRGNNDVEDFAILEEFGELKLFDVGENFDFTSVRGGIQFLVSDFNGFIFQDFNLAGQAFGELSQNRYRWSAVYAPLLAKENGLLTFDSQNRDVFFSNLIIEDFLRPGFNSVFSVHHNRDRSLEGRKLDVSYVGVASAGHWGRIVFSPAFYYAFGTEEDASGNSLDIAAFLAGVELEYPSDYMNYRAAAFISSGDNDPADNTGGGFASINENIKLFGAGNSFGIGGAAFSKPNSFIPSNQGVGSQFINPGMLVLNAGLDVVFTPKLFFTSNLNYFRFLQDLVTESTSLGLEVNGAINYRVFLNENFVLQLGANVFFPQDGAKELLGSEDAIFTANIALVTLF